MLISLKKFLQEAHLIYQKFFILTDKLRVNYFGFSILILTFSFMVTGCSFGGSWGSLGSQEVLLSSDLTSIAEGDSLRFIIKRQKKSDSATPSSSSSVSESTVDSKNVSIQLSYESSGLLDAQNAPQEITLPAGQESIEVSFVIPLDYIYQSHDRILRITAKGAEPLEVKISNADPFPELSVVATPTLEGNAATLSLTLSRAADVDLEFPYTFISDSATSADYSGTGGVARFDAGLKNSTVNVGLNANSICEATKGFFVRFSPPAASAQPVVQVRQDILENSPITYSLNSVSITEGSSGNITLTSNLSCPFSRSLGFSTVDSTAIAGTHYTAFTNRLITLPSGQSSVSFSVQTLDDLIQSPSKEFSVQLVSASVGTMSGSGVVTVLDHNPTPTLSWTAASSSIARANSSTTISWQLNRASGYDITAQVSLAGTAVPGTDYDVSSTSFTIPAGVTSGTFSIQMFAASIYDGSKTVILSLNSLTHANLGGVFQHTLTLTDALPQVSISGTASMTEGGTATYTISLNKPSTSSISVSYATSDSTAVQGVDFTAISGSLTFLSGETSKSLPVVSIDNSTVCQANRSYSVVLSSASGATLSTSTATTSLVDDDYPTLSVANISATEGTTATLQATLSQACGYTVQFSWATQNGTALSGTDYTATSGVIVIPIGSTTAAMNVVLKNDQIDQGNRSFTVRLSSPVRLQLPGADPIVTIVDDETAPTLSFAIANATALDSVGRVDISVNLSHPTVQAVTAALSFGGTAVYNQDYTLSNLSVLIPVGESSQIISLYPVKGTGGKTITLNLGAPSRGTLTSPSSFTLTLEEDLVKRPVMVSLADSSRLLYLSGLSSGTVFPLSLGIPTTSSGARISLAAANSPQVTDYGFSGDQQRAVFIGNNQRSSSLDLFSIRTDGSSLLQLNTTGWVAGRNVQKFKAVGTTSKIVFLADRVSGGATADLYSVNADSSALVTLVTGLSGSQTIYNFDTSSDGLKVVFTSNQQGSKDLFSVSPTGSNLVKLNSTLSAGQSVDQFAITPDGSKVVFTIKGSSGESILYVVPIGSGSVTQLSQYVAGRSVSQFKISPDSTRIGYLHNATSVSNYDLFHVHINGSSRLQMNQNLISGGSIKDFGFAPNSSKFYFLGEVQVISSPELYAVNVDGTALTKLSSNLPSGGRIKRAEFTPNSNLVIYLGQQDSASASEVYAVTPLGTGRVKLNLTPVSGGQITDFLMTNDSSKVIYMGDQDFSGIAEVFSVNVNGSQRVRISSSGLTTGKKANAIFLTPNNSRLLYRANLDDSSRYDWYSITVDGGSSVKIFAP